MLYDEDEKTLARIGYYDIHKKFLDEETLSDLPKLQVKSYIKRGLQVHKSQRRKNILLTVLAVPVIFSVGAVAIHQNQQHNKAMDAYYQALHSRVRTGAVCEDGWHSSATGSGACSWYGGVLYWQYNKPLPPQPN